MLSLTNHSSSKEPKPALVHYLPLLGLRLHGLSVYRNAYSDRVIPCTLVSAIDPQRWYLPARTAVSVRQIRHRLSFWFLEAWVP